MTKKRSRTPTTQHRPVAILSSQKVTLALQNALTLANEVQRAAFQTESLHVQGKVQKAAAQAKEELMKLSLLSSKFLVELTDD